MVDIGSGAELPIKDELSGIPVDDRVALREALAGALDKSGLGNLARNEKISGTDLLRAVGGVRGLMEATLPGLIFLVFFSGLTTVFSWSKSDALALSLICSVGMAVMFAALRLVTRSDIAAAVGGLFAVGLSAWIAWVTGEARDNFLPGLWTNIVICVIALVSLSVRWPAVGLVVAALKGDLTTWRADKRKYRVGQFLTLIWLVISALRITVQWPLYLSDNVIGLGLAKILMGNPLYAIFLLLCWLMVRASWDKADAGSIEKD